MNIAYFILPKVNVAFLRDDFTVRQGLEKMRHHGYTAIPVVDKNNKYVGTVSEGDFLWYILDCNKNQTEKTQIKNFEDTRIRDVLSLDKNPPVRITATVEELLSRALNQNFVPVIDDIGSFVGIVTRKDIINYFAKNRKSDK